MGHPAGHRGAQARGAGAGTVEPVPAGRPRARRRADEPAVRAAGRDHGPQPVDGARGAQLFGPGHRQHGAAVAVRDRRAEGAVAGAAAGGRDPLGVLDDRAGRRVLRRDQHRDAYRARRRRLRHQRAQVVDLRRDVAPLRAPHRDGRHRSRCRAAPSPEHDPRPQGHARGCSSCARRASSDTTTALMGGTPRSSTTTSACRRRTCWARRATVSAWPRSDSAWPHPPRDAGHRDGRAGPGYAVPADRRAVHVRTADHRPRRGSARGSPRRA